MPIRLSLTLCIRELIIGDAETRPSPPPAVTRAITGCMCTGMPGVVCSAIAVHVNSGTAPFSPVTGSEDRKGHARGNLGRRVIAGAAQREKAPIFIADSVSLAVSREKDGKLRWSPPNGITRTSFGRTATGKLAGVGGGSYPPSQEALPPEKLGPPS
jgi:hypothetical protein